MSMEILCGKRSLRVDEAGLQARLQGLSRVWVDLGTGDGRLVRTIARAHPDWLVIGLDACREPLHEMARTAPSNALFVIAHLPSLPDELIGLADQITIICPWGSLLRGLVDDSPALGRMLRALGRPTARLEIVVNEGAFQQVGWSALEGRDRIVRQLSQADFVIEALQTLDSAALRVWPTSWARRLASGGHRHADQITAVGAPGLPRRPERVAVLGQPSARP